MRQRSNSQEQFRRSNARCFDCRAPGRTALAAFALKHFVTSIAPYAHLQDGRMVDEAVDGRERHGLVGEDLCPIRRTADWP